jgi:hypothetical protein
VRKLFVSYSRNDKAVAQRVAHALSTQGYDVFWDAEIPPGQKFDTYIFSQLEQSDAVIVLWSTSSITSDYVKEEAEYAKMNSVLVPVRIDEVALPFGFTRIHTTDLLHWHGSIQDPDWRRIVRAIDSSIAQAFTAKAHCRPDEPTEASQRSVPVEAVKPRRNDQGVPALLATVILVAMLVGLVAFVLRSV